MPRTPKPGTPVRGSTTGRPVMALLDLAGRRWVLRILWELRNGPLTFRALQEACGGISPSVLNQRLADLRAAKLAAAGKNGGYELTPLGRDLLDQFGGLDRWAAKWAKALDGGSLR